LQASPSIHLLLVEDDDNDAELIVGFLQQITSFDISFRRVITLQQAIEECRSTEFSVILLDLGLPDSTGLQTVKSLSAQQSNSPIVVLTGNPDSQLEAQAVRCGAQDYLDKLTLDSDRIARAIRFAIERERHQLDQRKLEHANLEFSSARTIQESLLPQATLSIPGYDLAGCCFSADRVGGDYFDFFPANNGKLIIACGDAAGHGLAAAMVVTQLRSVLRTLVPFKTNLNESIQHLHNQLADDIPSFLFATLTAVQLEPVTGFLQYFCAGHQAFVLDVGGHVRQTLSPQTGPLFNMTQDADWSLQQTRMVPGEILLMYTDGLTESNSRDPFGDARMLQKVRALRNATAREIVSKTIDAAVAHAGKSPPQDDITLVVLKRDLH
jgi:serine phosphatase RsbU (regulator of sigma subunit)